MADRLLQIVKQTGIFIVCAQMLLHFKPAECYEKYIRLLISIMVLAQVIAGVSAILGQEGGLLFQGRVDYYSGLLAESMEEADLERMEEILEQMTMREVQARVNAMQKEQEAAQTGQGGVQAQAGTETQEGGAALQGADLWQESERKPSAASPEGTAGQPVEEIDIEIDRIEVSTGD